MELRPYQKAAVGGCVNSLRSHASALAVMPTGCGKTIVFSETIRLASKRCLVVAHREELIRQAAKKIEAMTGEKPSIEMAEEKSYEPYFGVKSKVVVASVQTLNAKNHLGKRMNRFTPDEFSLLVIDEAHHSVANSYLNVINYFRRNRSLKVIGVSATPDRSDKLALGEVFEDVAYKYELLQAVKDGWLVPIRQTVVRVESLDFSKVNKVAGDLNQRQLAEVMEYEKNLHGVVTPTLELTGDRKTIVFASSVLHATRIAEILNRHKPASARMLCGKTPKDLRATMIEDYASNKFQYLVNVGITVEGFDDPGVSVIVMARPSSSRSLVAQQVGRGTRPLANAFEGISNDHSPESCEARRRAIKDSRKPYCEVIDFVGNSGRHKLMYASDILGGEAKERACEIVREKTLQDTTPTPVDIIEELERAERVAEAEEAEQDAVVKRSKIKAEVKYKARDLDPFDVLQIATPKTVWTGAKPLSVNQQAMLERTGIQTHDVDNHTQRLLFNEIVKRRKDGTCTYKQAKLLRKYGYTGKENFSEASRIIDDLAANGWKKP
jgi:superfamily II DNA or RNA helicase